MCRYVFWAGSIQGLEICVEIYAHSFKEAKNKLMKYMSLNKEGDHIVKDVEPSGWDF